MLLAGGGVCSILSCTCMDIVRWIEVTSRVWRDWWLAGQTYGIGRLRVEWSRCVASAMCGVLDGVRG